MLGEVIFYGLTIWLLFNMIPLNFRAYQILIRGFAIILTTNLKLLRLRN